MYVWQLIFKEQLSPKKLGFLNVIELVGALSDILHVEFREGEQDLLVFDADMKPLPPGEFNYNMKQTWFLVVPVRTRKTKAFICMCKILCYNQADHTLALKMFYI